MATTTPKKKVKKIRRNISHAIAHITCTFNNTIITFADLDGASFSWASAGSSGFKGTRKSTPYAAQVASENASSRAKSAGVEKVDVYIKGVGVGRDQALRGLLSQDFDVASITDLTSRPHGGVRVKKIRKP